MGTEDKRKEGKEWRKNYVLKLCYYTCISTEIVSACIDMDKLRTRAEGHPWTFQRNVDKSSILWKFPPTQCAPLFTSALVETGLLQCVHRTTAPILFQFQQHVSQRKRHKTL